MHNVIIVVMAIVMGLTPLPTVNQPPNITESTAPKISVVEQKASAAEKPKTEEAKPVEVKETTWQDNPQNCNQETQFISQEAPFNCIDKPVAPPAPAPAPQAVPADDGSAKMFIYMRESGNNPGAINASSGACGLGQALPCSKMPCSLSDYACQDNFFTGYMQNRYGTWENAKAFWLSHHWW